MEEILALGVLPEVVKIDRLCSRNEVDYDVLILFQVVVLRH